MKKIVTALGESLLNEELKKDKDFIVLTKDIQYQEGIIELLEENKKIDIEYLIINENLYGENKIEKLIDKIINKNKYIKIIIILENENKNLEKILYKKGILKIYYRNKVNIKEIISFLKNNKKEEQIKKIEKINNKKILTKNVNNITKENIKMKEAKIISIAGTGGVGKSVVALNFSNSLVQKNKKILIIDFDILNNSLHTILGVNKYSQKIKKKIKKNDLISNKINIKELLIKINKNIDLISGINLIFDEKYKISDKKIKEILGELKQYYSYIIIDTSYECFFNYTKNILKNSNEIIFLLESNLTEIKKAQNLLNIYTNEWNIDNKKIKILINKYNKNSIDNNIIKEIFSKYKLLGKIKFNSKYNILINKNYEKEILTNKIKKEYIRVSEKIFKLKNRRIKLLFNNYLNKYKYKIKLKNI